MEFFESLLQLAGALWNVIVDLGSLLLPWTPLFAWIVFWMFAVNWLKLRKIMLKGGWVGVLLIGFVWILVWGTISPPIVAAAGKHHIFGLTLSNYVGKTVYVTMIYCIMFLSGSVQLSGALGKWCLFTEEEEMLIAENHSHDN
ncbi:hypothetical protein MNBD_PLANCTO02-959 [hydrothermal vent metagenome]|uniref:Uncharacterized protein n=1 Tax=hydrothermal vent metagenome TaxID=652676 RepID=A0A3B1DXB4_9ZZZZ